MHRKYTFLGGPAENASSPTILDRIKFMILFHLQRLGAQRSDSRFFNFWEIKCRKKCKKKYSEILCFFPIVDGFVLLF